MAWENFSIGAFYNITKNQDNPIKTVGRDSFLSPKTPKNTSFLGVTQPQGSHSRSILGDTTRSRHITYVLSYSDAVFYLSANRIKALGEELWNVFFGANGYTLCYGTIVLSVCL